MVLKISHCNCKPVATLYYTYKILTQITPINTLLYILPSNTLPASSLQWSKLHTRPQLLKHLTAPLGLVVQRRSHMSRSSPCPTFIRFPQYNILATVNLYKFIRPILAV